MSTTIERADELIDGDKRNRRALVTPEGVPLEIKVAGHGERLSAFFIDLALLLGATLVLSLLVSTPLRERERASLGTTLVLFLAFLVRNCYFLHFELAWQGRTPGKKACHLRVVNRDGGELTPGAIIARNLTREIEFFIPFSLYFSLDASGSLLQQGALLGWLAAVATLPLWNRDHLRAGDLIGGTMVIAMPKRILLKDLAVSTMTPATAVAPEGYSFSHEQLAIYGALELQVLEEFLRRPDTPSTQLLLKEVCTKICRKIGWDEPVPPEESRRFLSDFYAAERGSLERDKLFGRMRADKTDVPPRHG